MYSSNPPTERCFITLGHTYILANAISAMQALPPVDDEVCLSPVSKLPRGAEITTCGAGFDWQTVKVFYQGHFYYVFLCDLEERKLILAAAG
ncbi:MAG: hypothetical protein JWP08_3718 [Bryobacterales bacterium]|jgi:hypothetical protein|nr:hypothetical protein [Bryobacterales bacterium]